MLTEYAWKFQHNALWDTLYHARLFLTPLQLLIFFQTWHKADEVVDSSYAVEGEYIVNTFDVVASTQNKQYECRLTDRETVINVPYTLKICMLYYRYFTYMYQYTYQVTVVTSHSNTSRSPRRINIVQLTGAGVRIVVPYNNE